MWPVSDQDAPPVIGVGEMHLQDLAARIMPNVLWLLSFNAGDSLAATSVQRSLEATGAPTAVLAAVLAELQPDGTMLGEGETEAPFAAVPHRDARQEAISEPIATITSDNASAWFVHGGYFLRINGHPRSPQGRLCG